MHSFGNPSDVLRLGMLETAFGCFTWQARPFQRLSLQMGAVSVGSLVLFQLLLSISSIRRVVESVLALCCSSCVRPPFGVQRKVWVWFQDLSSLRARSIHILHESGAYTLSNGQQVE
eukprot:1023831-Amphidinium_carterae.1